MTNWLLSAAIDRNLQSLQMKINNSSPEALRKALEETTDFEDFTNSNALHLIAKLFDGEGFIELIEKIPADYLNQIILKTNGWQMNGLQCALVFQRREEGILLLLTKLDDSILNQALAVQDGVGYTGFVAALEYQPLPILKQVITEHTKNSFLESMFIVDQYQKSQINFSFQKAPSPILKKILSWLDDATLEKALRSEDAEGNHGLHFITLHQDQEIIQTIAQRCSSKVLSELALLNNKRNLNYLHFLCAESEPEILLSFLEKISNHTLPQALMQLDNEKWSPFVVALAKQNEEVITAMLKVLSDVHLDKIFSVVDRSNQSAMLTMLLNQNESLFQSILHRLSHVTIKKSLHVDDTFNNSVLKECALRYTEETLHLLIEHADAEIIDKELTTRRKDEAYDGWNLLNMLALAEQDSILEQVLSKASESAVEAACKSVCRNFNADGYNVLTQLANFGKAHDFVTVMDRLTPDTLNQVIVQANKISWTPLLYATFNFNQETMLTISTRILGETIEHSLLRAVTNIENRGITVLHQLLFNQPFEVVKAFCDKVSQNALVQAFLMKLQYGDHINYNALTLITHHCDNHILNYFLQRIPKDKIAEAAQVQTIHNTTAIHYAARFLRAESILQLLDCLNDEQFNEIMSQPADLIDVKNATPLHLILMYQFPEVCLQILHRMNKYSIEKAMVTKTSNGFTPLSSILSLFDYQTISFVLQSMSDDALRSALQDTHNHYYQMLIANGALTNDTAPLILNEIRERTLL